MLKRLTDKVANFCSLVTQAQITNQQRAFVPYTKYNESIARAFLREGLIKSYQLYSEKSQIILNLKYNSLGVPLIKKLVRESKSKKYMYLSKIDIERYKKAELFFLTTSKGVVSNSEALELKIGGKIILSVIL